MTAATEIVLSSGDRVRVQGPAADVERVVLAAARGSLMELAWLTEVPTGEAVGVNPEHVQMLRALAESPATRS